MSIIIKKYKKKNIDIILLLIYLFIDYGSPQGLIPALGYFYPGIVLIGLLGINLIISNSIKFDNVQSKCILGFFLLSVIHTPIAVNNYCALQGAKAFLIYVIIFLSVISAVNSKERLFWFINLWIGINVIAAIIGIIHGGFVPFSTFMGDENDFALVMNMTIPLAYFLFINEESLSAKILYLLSCGLFIAAGAISLSRGGFIGLIPVIIYCWYKTPQKVLATAVIVIMVGTLYLTAPDTYWERIKSIKEESIEIGSGEERWVSWKAGWQMFINNPIIGIGPGNYPWHVAKYQPEEDLMYRYSLSGRVAHSIYFTLIPEFGIIGIILFASMLYHTYKNNRNVIYLERKMISSHKRDCMENKIEMKSVINELQKIKYYIFGTQGAILGYLVSGIFISVFYYPHFWLLTAISISIKNIYEKVTKDHKFLD